MKNLNTLSERSEKFITHIKEKVLVSEKESAKFKEHLSSGLQSFQLLHTQELAKLLREQRLPNFSPEVAEAYQEDFYQRTITNARLTLILAIVIYGASGLLDLWALPLSHEKAWMIRYTSIFFVLVPGLLLSFTSFFKKNMQSLSSFVVIFIGLNILALCTTAEPEEIGSTFYYTGLILIIMCAYTVAQLRFSYALFTGWFIFFAFEGVAVIDPSLLAQDDKLVQFFMANFIFVATNIIGMVAAYMMEVYRRRDFLQRTLLNQEQRKSERLLRNILPESIVALLKDGTETISDYYENVSILFADVVNFTELSKDLSPKLLVELLNDVFSSFDELVDHYKLEKIKTIGDCYMVAAGVPQSRDDHAHILAKLALDMISLVKEQKFLERYKLSFRIGINSGPVVAGVIGRKKFLYDLWGDAVNTASRMESQGSENAIQITEHTYFLIKDDFHCEFKGELPIKGKGLMRIWHVHAQTG